MSDEKTAPPLPAIDMSVFASMIGAAVQQAQEQSNPKRVTFGKYIAKKNAGRPKLTRDCYQNGRVIDAGVLSNEEINLLNKIDRTGRYIDRMVEVVVREEGADETVDIRFSNKTAAAFELKGRARNFEHILEQIVAAQVEERKEDEEKNDRKVARRSFGDTKAFREAAAKAGA
jgi:hypothetical protein